MSRGLITLFAAMVTAAALPANGQVITNVSRHNPNPASSAAQVRLAPQPMADGARLYADRVHVMKNVPKTMIGAQYILTSNEDKYNPDHELHITIGQAGTLYLYIDVRVGTGLRGPTVTANPAAAGMTWVASLGFVDTGTKLAIDENANGSIDNYYSVFSLQVTPGVVILRAQNDWSGGNPYDRNMYGVAAKLVNTATGPVPANGARVVAPPLLQWTAGADAVMHNLYVGAGPELGQADLIGPGLSVRSFQYCEVLIPGATYYWRVDEIEADMTTVHTGDVWTFQAMSITAFDPAPADGMSWMDLDTTLSWKAGMDAVMHDLYLGTDKAAVESGAASVLLGTTHRTEWELPPLEADTTYFWRVDEVAADDSRQAGPVWSFSTIRKIAISDPNLLVWWKMDEGPSNKAADWSGHGRHARLANPAPAWTTGLFNGALLFAGNGESAVYEDGSFLNGLDALTITAWVKSKVTDTDKGLLIFETPTGNDDRDLRYDAAGINGGGVNVIKVGLTIATEGGDTTLQAESSDGSQTTDWQHLAMVWASGQDLQLYINGELDSLTFSRGAGAGRLTGYSTMTIGKAAKDTPDSSWDGLIDEIRIYNKALTEEQVQAAMRSDPLLAWAPWPGSGARMDISKALPLTWQPGDKAISHDIYLSTDRAAVNEANVSDTTGVYCGRLSETSYMPEPPPELCVTYFWRVDEINEDGSISRGFIWDFILDD